MAALPRTAGIVVIGGGVVGMATALALAEAGARPLLLEARAFGGAVSGGSLAAIGTHMHGLAEFAVMRHACALWREISARSGDAIEYDASGQLGFILDPEGVAAGTDWVRGETALGAECALLDPAEVRALEPRLTGPILAATWAPDTATVNPFRAVRALKHLAEAAGAVTMATAPVTGIEAKGGRVAGVTLADGARVDCGQVVLAAGPWTRALARHCGADLPMRPRQAQCLATLRQPSGTLRRVVSACEGAAGGVASGYTQIQQSAAGQILFNTVTNPVDSAETAPDHVHEVPPGFVVESVAMLGRLFPALGGLPVLRSWVRFEAVTPDARFLCGALPLEGAFVAAGDNGSGFCRAPMLGRHIAGLATGQGGLGTDLDRQARALYAPGRFHSEAA